MKLNNVRENWPWMLFVVVTLLGLLFITYAYRISQTISPNPPIDETLTDRQKLLLASEGEMSKWLLGLASGAIAAVASVRLKDSGNRDVVGVLPMIAYSFLLLSLYGAFLAYESAVNILRLGPLNYLYGDQLELPVLVQFWTLIVGLAFLGIWLFRRKTVQTVVVLIALSLCETSLHAEDANLPDCTQRWYNDRLGLSPPNTDLAVSVLKRLEQRPGAKQIKTCVDADSVLDQLRLSSMQASEQVLSGNFDKYLTALNDELGHPGLSTSDVVQSVLKIMSPWDKPLGILFVHSTKGTYNILLNTSLVGVTNWSRRLEPGTYRIRVIRHLDAVYSDNALTIVAGQTKEIDVDKLTQ